MGDFVYGVVMYTCLWGLVDKRKKNFDLLCFSLCFFFFFFFFLQADAEMAETKKERDAAEEDSC